MEAYRFSPARSWQRLSNRIRTALGASAALAAAGVVAAKFSTGDRVIVRSAADILSTLDADGTLDGLPFMPEMLDWCGKPFRVLRRVEKTCVAGGYPMRSFPENDVVILDGPRCDGNGHDGCKHGCRIFWKEAWLQPVDAGNTTQKVEIGREELRARLKVKSDEHRYFCQSTELYRATGAFRASEKYLTARIALREIRSGDVSAARILMLLARWFRRKLRRATGGDHWLQGDLKRTPTQSLNLQPGDIVRVKSRDEIAKTLDQRGLNRGMGICSEMLRCCRSRAEVRYRVDRLIDEKTGLMRELSDTVTLTNILNDESLAEECLCYRQLGDCPRGEVMYWREIWLERVTHDRT
ncbi:MAG: hypothetical protein JWO88_3832 [Frankiales bacterium]|nr:hypothetical protein [Frankiales bacterium]